MCDQRHILRFCCQIASVMYVTQRADRGGGIIHLIEGGCSGDMSPPSRSRANDPNSWFNYGGLD